MSSIAEMIRQLAAQGRTARLFNATVTRVDEAARTVDVMPLEDDTAPVLGVGLQAVEECSGGLLVIPTEGSVVTVAMFDEYAAGVVVLTSDIDRIVINGGSLGGLINIAVLTQKLNAMVQTFNSHTHTCPNGTTAIPTQQATAFEASDYEDDTVVH